MSVAFTHRLGSEAFSQLARLFNGLKRRGRVIDVMWFQQSADYARAVLALADECDDDAVRDIGASLRQMLGDYVAMPKPAPAAVAGALATGRNAAVKLASSDVSAVTTAREPAPAVMGPEESGDRYVGRLR